MILDRLSNAETYYNLHPRIAQGLAYLQNLQIDAFEDKKVEIDGEALFGVFQQYEGRAVEKGKWESHLRYVDIQYIYAGVERMDVMHIDALGEPYLVAPERDVIFYPAPEPTPVEQTSLMVPAGSFAIFFHHDGHRPSLRISESDGLVQKIVLKVLLSD